MIHFGHQDTKDEGSEKMVWHGTPTPGGDVRVIGRKESFLLGEIGSQREGKLSIGKGPEGPNQFVHMSQCLS